MIEAICIDASNKPNDIPNSKWLVEGEIYHIIYTTTVLPQRKLAFHLAEISLDESCYPYEYFLSTRFAIMEEDIEALEQLIKDCDVADLNVGELMKEIKLTGLT
jgi:hypothetical protein